MNIQLTLNIYTMENICLLIKEAVTTTNSKSNNSRLVNQKIYLTNVIFKREDGHFYENIIFENCEWRPFLRLENGFIELQNMSNKKSNLIIIKKYEEKYLDRI